MRRIFGSLFLCLAAVAAFVLPTGTAHAAGHRPVIFVHGYNVASACLMWKDKMFACYEDRSPAWLRAVHEVRRAWF